MDRKILGPVTSLVTLMMINGSAAQDCTADTAWQRVRQAYPLHSQTLARCTDQTGKVVVVLTEPPPHLTRLSAPTIVKTLLPLPEGAMQSVQRRRHPLGFDGWAEDLVLVIDTRSGVTQDRLDDSLALLATLAFGSSYKAEIEDIFSLTFTKNRQAPPALEVSKEELFAWLLGPQAHKLTAVDGGSMATLRERAGRNEFGTFYSDPSGLVVAILPRATSGVLNDYVPEIRQFVVDSDVFLGAIRLSDSQVALVGRERTTKLSDVPPLRLETILLLASERAAQMSQSYERRRAFAGKLLTDAGDLFGWDWAPILLSDVLIDTEFGSLLNFTDNMLKSWSESGKISYRGFPHTAPDHFPFGTTGALRTMGTNRLTYNWNTAGVGLISSMGGVDLFTLRNTGSLPISYFPEGSEDNPSTKSKLVNAEDQAYGYFRSLRNPLLARAVQYAALYQTFLTFDVRARRPHGAAPATASMDKVEQVLTQSVTTAVDRLVSSSVATNKEMFLSFQYEELGSAAQHLQSLSSPPEIQKKLNEVRSKISQNAAALDREYGQEWRGLFAKLLAEGRPIPPKLKEQLESVALGLRMVESPENVRRAVVGLLDHSPDGWLKTPSIVLSKADDSVRTFVGGHNIGGRATRVELDAAIPKGEVRASGSYESGRVLRLNPADKDAERDAVRLFDREVGLRDENLSKGTRAVETRLREAPILARPVRAATDALEAPTSRVVRGALSETNAKQVGYRPAEMTLASHPELEAAVLQAKADVVVAATPPGFVVVRPRPAPPKLLSAPNPTSMHEAVNVAVRQVSLGPPTMLSPKIAFHGMERADALRHIQSLVQRGEAVAGAGGKPPFGGNRPLYGLADAPEPNRSFTYSMMDRNGRATKHEPTFFENTWDSILSLAGKRRQRIHTEASATLELSATPQWSKVEIQFPRAETTQFIGVPSAPGQVHIVEVTVPVTIASKPQSLLFRAMAWFKESPSVTKAKEINTSLETLFKSSDAINVEEALIRYKTLMIDRYGASDVRIHLQREGSDIVVTDNGHEARSSRG